MLNKMPETFQLHNHRMKSVYWSTIMCRLGSVLILCVQIWLSVLLRQEGCYIVSWVLTKEILQYIELIHGDAYFHTHTGHMPCSASESHDSTETEERGNSSSSSLWRYVSNCICISHKPKQDHNYCHFEEALYICGTILSGFLMFASVSSQVAN